LKECASYPAFQYIPRTLVQYFRIDPGGRIRSAVAKSLLDDSIHQYEADRFVLAAGTLSSSKIFMDTIRQSTGEIPKLSGLMDNRQVLIPFVNIHRIGDAYEPESYQYHQLAFRISRPEPEKALHALITTLKTALVHPIVQNIPLHLPGALFLFRNVRAGLGLVNLNFPDERREDNFVTLRHEKENGTTLLIRYSPVSAERALVKNGMATVKRFLRKLGCFVPPGMTHIRPMGASVHYAGTIPMSREHRPLTTTPDCRSREFENLWIVDGSTFPSLPAKNLTFTLMANAARVADQSF
jgi:hypothetical protein